MLVSGESGIGKSRLALELERRARADEAIVLTFQGSAQHTNSDLYPLLLHLDQAAGVRRGEPQDRRQAKIQKLLDDTTSRRAPAGLLEGLVSLGDADQSPSDLRRSRQQRNALLNVFWEGIAGLAKVKPVLIVIHDAQWFDPTSVAVLEGIVQRCGTQRVLCIVTALRAFQPTWIDSPTTTLIVPHRLNPADATALAAGVAGADVLLATELQRVVERSEGVPLYVEEFIRAAATDRLHSAAHPEIPTDLHSVLQVRLGRLGPAKRLAQILSAFGRRFDHDVGVTLSGGDEAEFERLLHALMAADIVLAAPVVAGTSYVFRHGLIQDAAYGSLDAVAKRDVHTRIVEMLEAQASESSADQPEIIAYHCDRAGLALRAAECWLAAGKASGARGSVVEAVNYFELGLAAIRGAADVDATKSYRALLVFDLNMNLGPALMARDGYASDDGLAAFKQASDHLHLARSSMEQIHVLLGLFNVHFGRGELIKAMDVAQRADSALTMGYGGYPVLMGQALCIMGRFPEARTCLERALANYIPDVDAHAGLFCRADVVATSFLAKTEFALGHQERARRLTADAMTMARQQGHPVALAIAYLGQMFIATEMGDMALATAVTDEAYSHARRHELADYLLWVTFHRAVLTMHADPASAIGTMGRLLEQAEARGTFMFRPAQLGLLGVAYSSVGRHAEAIAQVDAGLHAATITSGFETLPALHRLRAKILIARKEPEAALADVERALVIAKAQSAQTEVLRAATMLARMVETSVRFGPTHAYLAELYATFTDGVDFPDLKHAARVLRTANT